MKEVKLHEALGIAPSEHTANKKGDEIVVAVQNKKPKLAAFYAEKDPDYVFPMEPDHTGISPTKMVLAAIMFNKTLLLHGPHGCGKTSLIEQLCVALNLPFIRQQHTESMEKFEMTGETQLSDGLTHFNPALLPLAARYGGVFVADEYDRARNGYTGEYQAIMEGKPLVIPNVPADKDGKDWRQVKLHKDFRFFATGNTNGQGDASGVYLGVQLGNGANYSRFNYAVELGWLPAESEIALLEAKTKLHTDQAKLLVNLANKLRRDGDVKLVPSTRELLEVADAATLFTDMKVGFEVGYAGRLPSDQKTAAMRALGVVFGDTL